MNILFAFFTVKIIFLPLVCFSLPKKGVLAFLKWRLFKWRDVPLTTDKFLKSESTSYLLVLQFFGILAVLLFGTCSRKIQVMTYQLFCCSCCCRHLGRSLDKSHLLTSTVVATGLKTRAENSWILKGDFKKC